MLNKLKIKFTVIAFGSMFSVLIIVLILVNVFSYKNVLEEVFAILDYYDFEQGSLVIDEQAYGSHRSITPESVFEYRYFTIDINDDGTIIDYNHEHIAAIDDDDLSFFFEVTSDKYHYPFSIRHIINNFIIGDQNKGIIYYNGLSYAYKRKAMNGFTRVAIMDCTSRLVSARSYTTFSLYIGFLCMLIMLLLLSIFSRKAVEPIVKNITAQKQFITNASHELKTPLAVIAANTEVLEMMNGKNEWTESTTKQINRMSDLISQLVVLSKLEERSDLVLSEVDFSKEANEVAASFKTIADTAEKNFTAEIEEGVVVNADQKGIHELINILLDNAVKYCDEGGDIGMKLYKKGKMAHLEVSNSYKDGEGVDYRRFFDRFYREDESHNSEKKGYGIGLSMADSLVRMFKGKINVGYKKGIITFTVIL